MKFYRMLLVAAKERGNKERVVSAVSPFFNLDCWCIIFDYNCDSFQSLFHLASLALIPNKDNDKRKTEKRGFRLFKYRKR